MKTELVIKNAVIEGTMLGVNDHGLLDCWLTLTYGITGQGFGGYALYLPKCFDHHKVESVAGHHIYRILQVAEVDEWSKLKGKSIRVKTEGEWGKIVAIGHIIKEDWFCPETDYAFLRKEKTV